MPCEPEEPSLARLDLESAGREQAVYDGIRATESRRRPPPRARRPGGSGGVLAGPVRSRSRRSGGRHAEWVGLLALHRRQGEDPRHSEKADYGPRPRCLLRSSGGQP